MQTTETQARVYVGTYAKYNSGSIEGKWLDLEDYTDRETFLEACAELHKDEADPEFMFQDHEGIPAGMIGESHISEQVWDWLALDTDDQELLKVYQEWLGDKDATIDDAREKFEGRFDSEEDWAIQYMEDTGGLSEMPENLRMYFDYEAFARDCRLGGDMAFIEHGGEVWAFNNH